MIFKDNLYILPSLGLKQILAAFNKHIQRTHNMDGVKFIDKHTPAFWMRAFICAGELDESQRKITLRKRWNSTPDWFKQRCLEKREGGWIPCLSGFVHRSEFFTDEQPPEVWAAAIRHSTRHWETIEWDVFGKAWEAVSPEIINLCRSYKEQNLRPVSKQIPAKKAIVFNCNVEWPERKIWVLESLTTLKQESE